MNTLALCAMSLLAAPAMATSTASATISNFSYTLIDLNPLDSVLPALVFSGDGSSSYANVDLQSDSDWAAGSFIPTSASVIAPNGLAQAMTDAFGGGQAQGQVSGGSFYSYAYPISASFTLTPWTGIILTAAMTGSAGTSGAVASNDYAQAYGAIQVSVNTVDNGSEYHYGQRYVYAGCGWDGNACLGESNNVSGGISLTYANLSDVEATGSLSAYAGAYGQSAVAVPEPGSLAMLLAGLLGVGAISARRRRLDR